MSANAPMTASPPVGADLDLALRLLTEAVASAGPRGKAAVAERLGVSRSYLARVLSPRDALAMNPPLARRILDCFHVIAACPASGLPQPVAECHRLSRGPAPTHNPLSMRIWRICCTCPYRPEES